MASKDSSMASVMSYIKKRKGGSAPAAMAGHSEPDGDEGPARCPHCGKSLKSSLPAPTMEDGDDDMMAPTKGAGRRGRK